MKVKSLILKYEMGRFEERLEKVKKLNAPQIVIEKELEEIQRIKDGTIKIIGNEDLLYEECKSYSIKSEDERYYLQFDNGTNYYPNYYPDLEIEVYRVIKKDDKFESGFKNMVFTKKGKNNQLYKYTFIGSKQAKYERYELVDENLVATFESIVIVDKNELIMLGYKQI